MLKSLLTPTQNLSHYVTIHSYVLSYAEGKGKIQGPVIPQLACLLAFTFLQHGNTVH